MAIICCDTSFLYSLYGNDSNSSKAFQLAADLRGPIVVSIFNEFEFENVVRISVFRKSIDSIVAAGMMADYATDKLLSKIVLMSCDLPEVLSQAKGLSTTHSQSGGHRAYDILHVAAAMRMGATAFISFDANQRKLARAVGLKVRPV